MKEAQARVIHSEDAFYDPFIKAGKFGTVGCVALDKNGNLAAGTSTGGMTNKRYGRIGDAPIIGAGTYANNKTCAVSATGWGEYFIRGVVAYDISALMEYKGLSVKEASQEVIERKIPALGGMVVLLLLMETVMFQWCLTPQACIGRTWTKTVSLRWVSISNAFVAIAKNK